MIWKWKRKKKQSWKEKFSDKQQNVLGTGSRNDEKFGKIGLNLWKTLLGGNSMINLLHCSKLWKFNPFSPDERFGGLKNQTLLIPMKIQTHQNNKKSKEKPINYNCQKEFSKSVMT